MSIGKKLMIGPSLTLHGGWQLVPLDAARQYGPKELFLVASTSAAVTLSTDASNSWILPAGKILRIGLDGAPLSWAKGDELVTSGAFATATGNSWWNYKASGNVTGWVIAGGSAHHRGATTSEAVLGQTLSITEDHFYEVQFDINHWGTGATAPIKVELGGTSLGSTGPTGIRTDITEVVVAANSTGPLRFKPNPTGAHMSIDNVSVKEVTGSQLLFAKGNTGVILQVMFTL